MNMLKEKIYIFKRKLSISDKKGGFYEKYYDTGRSIL